MKKLVLIIILMMIPVEAQAESYRTPCGRTMEAKNKNTYLGGYRYWRGINIYTLMLQEKGEPQASYDYLAKRYVKNDNSAFVRLAFNLERLYPVKGDLLSSLRSNPNMDYLCKVIVPEVEKIAKAKMRVSLDMHAGCTYPWGGGSAPEKYIICGEGSGRIQSYDWARLWKILSAEFKYDWRVISYDIMNEPRHKIGNRLGADGLPINGVNVDATMAVYKKVTQAVVNTIRANKDMTTIAVEAVLGPNYFRFNLAAPDGPWINDSRIVWSDHFYPNERYTADAENFGIWCTKFKVHCWVGETGTPMEYGWHHPHYGAEYLNQMFFIFNKYNMDVTIFTATGIRPCTNLISYCDTDGNNVIDSATWQTELYEAHLTRRW